MADVQMLPLFPLQAVLVPGAVLGLRIFEPRYLDMVASAAALEAASASARSWKAAK